VVERLPELRAAAPGGAPPIPDPGRGPGGSRPSRESWTAAGPGCYKDAMGPGLPVRRPAAPGRVRAPSRTTRAVPARRLGLALAAVSLPLALGTGPCAHPFPADPAATVHVDPAQRFQRIDGFGGSAADATTLRAMPEPDRSAVMDLVFGDLAPSVVRIKPRPAMEPVNDDGDPNHVNPAGFVRPDDHLWQVDEIFSRGDPKLLGALWTPPAWMKTTGQECCGGTLLPGMAPELAEFFSVYLSYLEAEGHPLDWLSIQNEPEAASPWDANTYGPAEYAATAEVIAQRLVADGHTTRLVGPDNALASFTSLFTNAFLLEPTVVSRLEAVAFHDYQFGYYDIDPIGASTASLRAAIPASLPLWMTEFSNTTGVGYGTWDEAMAQAELVHTTLVNGASMYVMWNLYRPGGPGEALVVIPTQLGAGGYTVTPKYWTFRQYCRYVRPGAVRIGAGSSDPDLLVSAYRDEGAGRTVAVLINRATQGRWALFDDPSLRGVPAVVRSSESESGVELPVDSTERFGPRGIHLPARSVTTVLWTDGGGAP
jgi:glucuronoarabinoxylan endo-1,4-beta-xylanase